MARFEAGRFSLLPQVCMLDCARFRPYRPRSETRTLPCSRVMVYARLISTLLGRINRHLLEVWSIFGGTLSLFKESTDSYCRWFTAGLNACCRFSDCAWSWPNIWTCCASLYVGSFVRFNDDRRVVSRSVWWMLIIRLNLALHVLSIGHKEFKKPRITLLSH